MQQLRPLSLALGRGHGPAAVVPMQPGSSDVHARAGCAGSMMPTAVKGALCPRGMRDGSKSCVQGVQALVGHTYI